MKKYTIYRVITGYIICVIHGKSHYTNNDGYIHVYEDNIHQKRIASFPTDKCGITIEEIKS